MEMTEMSVKPNRVRLRRIARLIEKYPDHFDMGSVVEAPGSEVNPSDPVKWLRTAGEKGLRECGTTACIAGWAVALYPQDVAPHDTWEDAACRVLGLDDRTGSDLFFATGMSVEQAAQRLRELAEP